jgi:hypothetical protein
MNFEQARELSFLVKWKVAECFSGPSCWCRRIVPVEPIVHTYNESSEYEEEYEIVGDASIDQKTAEYIVRLHNENYDRVQQSCRDAMKETIDSLIPINENEMIETFEKLWENKHSKIGKIVRKEID